MSLPFRFRFVSRSRCSRRRNVIRIIILMLVSCFSTHKIVERIAKTLNQSVQMERSMLCSGSSSINHIERLLHVRNNVLVLWGGRLRYGGFVWFISRFIAIGS